MTRHKQKPGTPLIVFMVLGALLMAGVAILFTRPDTPSVAPIPKTATENSTAADTTTPPDGTQANVMPGTYKDYSADAVDTTPGTKLLFFYADWCPQCRQLDASIRSGSIPENVTILKVDYDKNQALRKKYGVTIQTTLVKIDDSGTAQKYVAYSEPTLEAVKQNLLQ